MRNRYSEPTDSEHAIDPEPVGYDHDGVGRDEAKRVDGVAFHAVRESYRCTRDGCDTDARKHHIYALSDVDEEVQATAFEEIEWTNSPNAEDLVEWLSMRATIVDYDESPILGFEHEGEAIGYLEPRFTQEQGFDGPCYGHVEPEPDVHAHRYDL